MNNSSGAQYTWLYINEIPKQVAGLVFPRKSNYTRIFDYLVVERREEFATEYWLINILLKLVRDTCDLL